MSIASESEVHWLEDCPSVCTHEDGPELGILEEEEDERGVLANLTLKRRWAMAADAMVGLSAARNAHHQMGGAAALEMMANCLLSAL